MYNNNKEIKLAHLSYPIPPCLAQYSHHVCITLHNFVINNVRVTTHVHVTVSFITKVVLISV